MAFGIHVTLERISQILIGILESSMHGEEIRQSLKNVVDNLMDRMTFSE